MAVDRLTRMFILKGADASPDLVSWSLVTNHESMCL